MSLGTMQLSESLQALIDARLDTIDRMLLGRTTRSDRLAIVREVESQLFELLHEHGREELTREDVLAVLGRIDPPEAYLPDEDDPHVLNHAAARVRPGQPATRVAPARESKRKLAKTSGILGLSALALVFLAPLAYVVIASLASEAATLLIVLLLATIVLASFSTGLLALVLGAIGRSGGAWAVSGMITGSIGLFCSFCGAIVLLLELG
jgi:hypothetical protein